MMLTDDEFYKEYGVYPDPDDAYEKKRQELINEFDEFARSKMVPESERNKLSYRAKSELRLNKIKELINARR